MGLCKVKGTVHCERCNANTCSASRLPRVTLRRGEAAGACAPHPRPRAPRTSLPRDVTPGPRPRQRRRLIAIVRELLRLVSFTFA
ncbi:jg16298 [Pararge aegeria aegeria]|uniref:Jg16298 protein n=1 Tax=Pararge aegeria aegeria TaxID=348720 RepID=A0A8S4RX32_9NEOP|nr:jg16298 [Pararge aegeria aegeria]